MSNKMSLTYVEAEKIMAEALRMIREKNEFTSIIILDRVGKKIIENDTTNLTIYTESAHGKAIQASFTNETTHFTQQCIKKGRELSRITLVLIQSNGNLMPSGGVPVFNMAAFIGSIGISGLSDELNNEIAVSAVVNAGFSEMPEIHISE